MTQRDRVLTMLRSAGKTGVRSDAFLSAHIPRAAARVLELREEGFEISAERERQFCRYFLKDRAGVGAGVLPQQASSRTRSSVHPGSGSPGVRHNDTAPEAVSAGSSATPGEPARLFDPAPLSPFRDAEAA